MREQRRQAILALGQSMNQGPPTSNESEDDDWPDIVGETPLGAIGLYDHANGNGDGMGRSMGSADLVPTNGKPKLEADEVPHPPLQPHEKGMTVGYKQLYSGKEDKRGRFTWQTEIPKDLGKPAEDAETEKWALIVRRLRVYNNPKKVLSLHSIEVQSPLIRKILDQVLEGYPGVTTGLKRLQFSGRFEPLVHRWTSYRSAIADLKKKRDEGDETFEKQIQHAMLLDDLLVEEFSEVEEALEDMLENGVITFPHLWTIYQPNALIFARHEGQDRCLRLSSANYGVDNHNQPVFWLSCAYVDFDGQRFGTQKLNISIPTFEGTKRVNSLNAFPIRLHDQEDQIQAKLIERGAKVEALAGSHFRGYNGIGWRVNVHTGGKEKHTVKGRIVIDHFGYNRFQPDYAVYVTPFNSASAAAIPGRRGRMRVTISDLGGRPSPSGVDATPAMPHFVDPHYNLDDGVDDCGMPTDGFFDDEDNVKKRLALTEEQRMCCTPMVRGYALKEKQWLHFFVNAVSVSALRKRLAFP